MSLDQMRDPNSEFSKWMAQKLIYDRKIKKYSEVNNRPIFAP